MQTLFVGATLGRPMTTRFVSKLRANAVRPYPIRYHKKQAMLICTACYLFIYPSAGFGGTMTSNLPSLSEVI